MSANGRYVVFESAATNLIGDDTQNSTDVFYKDMDTGAIVRVATGGSGGYVQSARISADGRYVTFQSDADDLVAGDHNNSYDIFRKDMLTGAIERLSTTTVAAQGKVQANGSSIKPQVSADGRYVTFASDADNLVAGDGNHSRDIFRHDLATGETIRVSLGINGEAESGSSNAQVSADGRFVTFESSATNLLGDDTNPNHRDVFLRDLQLNTLVRVSATPTGTIANADSQNSRMTEDGKGVLFDTAASNLVTNDVTGYINIFYRDFETNSLTRLSANAQGTAANGHSSRADISADKSLVVFESDATNLAAGDGASNARDIFLRNMATLHSSAFRPTPMGPRATAAAITRGWWRQRVISSWCSKVTPAIFVAGDDNSGTDIFLYRQVGADHSVTRVSTGLGGLQADGSSTFAQLSADGRYVVFQVSRRTWWRATPMAPTIFSSRT